MSTTLAEQRRQKATTKSPAQAPALKLRNDLERLLESARGLELTPKGRSRLSAEVQKSAAALNGLLAELDPIDRPSAVFDPGNPRTVGYFVALALSAQPRRPLAALKDFYGTGVYALYYRGAFGAYQPISGSDTPIYVGMAVYEPTDRKDVSAMGTSLAIRLGEHRKNIQRAAETLNVDDFDYRALVVQSGWEGPAETHLIRMFHPIWNKETKILQGFGKHGDSIKTRANKRSPWDTLHAGRNWAGGEGQTDKKTPSQIEGELRMHFEKTTVYKSFEDVFASFVSGLRQSD
jgi:hypothetical protein